MDLIQGYSSDSSSAQQSQDGMENNFTEDSNVSFDISHFMVHSLNETEVDLKNKRKRMQLKRNTGQSYVTKSGKVVEKRTIKRLQECRKKCYLQITYEDQRRLFDSYWAQGTYSQRFDYINRHVQLKPKQRSRSRKNMGIRKFNVEYFLNDKDNRVSVCKSCFLKTLGETPGFIKTVVTKCWENMNDHSIIDQRGKSIPKNKSPASKIQEIKDHIQKFPVYECHNSKSLISNKYLSAALNVALMYRLYSKEVTAPLSLKMYRQVFHESGLKFKSLQLDICYKCDEFTARLKSEVNEEEKRLIEFRKEGHQMNVEIAYQAKKHDKEIAKKSDGSHLLLTFNLQQCLPTPLLKNSIAFYKRPLWVFNLSINCSTANTKCYMWHEAISNRGGNEIASCLYAYIQSLDSKVKCVTLYSDSCLGYNKNKIISAMLLATMVNHPTLEIIDYKFIESCNTHMECDSDRAIIEKTKRKYSGEIHHPDDWYHLLKTTTVAHPFDVLMMNQNDFYNFEKLSFKLCEARDIKKEKLDWEKVKWLRYTRNEKGVLYYKTSLSEEESFSIQIEEKEKLHFLLDNKLTNCFNGLVSISTEKKKDLLDLLNFIRPEARQFYQDLLSDDAVQSIDPDIEDIQTSQDEDEFK